MMRLLSAATLTGAALTGLFCAVFALAVDQVLNMLNWLVIAAVSFTSGFLGSLFAKAVMGARG